MSTFVGPNISSSGLVFEYDMKNNKSWLGKPTTNLYYAVNSYLNGNGNNWINSGSATYNDNDTSISPPTTPSTNPLPSLRISSVTTTAVGNQECGMGITSISPSTTYTMSIWVYIKGNTGVFSPSNGAAPYMRTNVNNNSIASFTYNGSADSTTWPTYKWIRIVATGTTQSNENGIYLSSYIGNTVGDTVYYYGFQVEQNSFATPLTAGPRTTSRAVVDMTGKNTITVSSLTYASDNTFSFDGSSNYLSASGSGLTDGMTAYTIMFWARRDAESRMPVAHLANTNFYWYGDNSWRYTHGGVSGEHYYSKPTSIPLGTWGHYCVTYDGATVSIYRQGIFQSSVASAGYANWGGGMQIGYWQGGGSYQWQGRIDQVSMFNRALTAAEVQQSFNALRNRYGI